MGNPLHAYYQLGQRAALRKFALATPSPADAFTASLDEGKDMEPPAMEAPVLPQEASAALGDPSGGMPMAPPPQGAPMMPPVAKEGALSPKDMAWFRDTLGEDAGKLFLDKHHERYFNNVQQDFKPHAPVATKGALPKPAPMAPAAPGGLPKVMVSPAALKVR